MWCDYIQSIHDCEEKNHLNYPVLRSQSWRCFLSFLSCFVSCWKFRVACQPDLSTGLASAFPTPLQIDRLYYGGISGFNEVCSWQSSICNQSSDPTPDFSEEPACASDFFRRYLRQRACRGQPEGLSYGQIYSEPTPHFCPIYLQVWENQP